MCGRARCTLRADDVPRACHRSSPPSRTLDVGRFRPSYNVSPGSNLPVVRRDDGAAGGGDGYAVHSMKWGLIPSFSKKTDKPDFYRMFNARSESIGEKASFRRLLPKNRCLVAVEGFYEWKKDGSKKQPYYIHFKDDRPLVFAALYDSWKNSEGEMLHTFTIVTTSSSSALQWLHDRMPVILGNKEATDMWLDGSSTPKINELLQPYEDPDLVWYPVTPAMGKPSFDGPECIKEINLKAEDKSTISKFFSRKEIKEEQEPKQEESDASEKSVKTALPKRVKGEPESEDKLGIPSLTKTADNDVKSSFSALTYEPKKEKKIKREHEELVGDWKLNTDEIDEWGASPAKKKANMKSHGDKQPTLLSYFGKK